MVRENVHEWELSALSSTKRFKFVYVRISLKQSTWSVLPEPNPQIPPSRTILLIPQLSVVPASTSATTMVPVPFESSSTVTSRQTATGGMLSKIEWVATTLSHPKKLVDEFTT